MANTLKLRGGTTPEVAAATLAEREIMVDTTKDVIVVGPDKNEMAVADGATFTGTTTFSGDVALSAGVAFGTSANANSLRIQNVGTPTAATDAATKAYVDSRTQNTTAADIKTAYESNANTEAFTTEHKNKVNALTGFEEQNVQADWNQSSPTHDAYIHNKPSFLTSQTQVNWNQTDSSSVDFILNKPSLLSSIDEDDLVSDAADRVPTQQSVKAYVDGQVATALPLSGGTLTGDVTFSATQQFDGRDLSADGTKLDAIEPLAKDDQTGAEIKALYEAEANTNAFTTAEKDKLNDIEALADVTDATNVAAAGAVMEGDTSTASMSFVVDEDNMASDLDTKVPTQQSVKAYVDTSVAGVVDSAPATLDTLNELAAALGDDANFATTVSTSIGEKLPKAGGTMTGNIVFNSTQTFDGRDVSADGTKLDAIEANAKDDQTGAEIKALYEAESNTNAFTDAQVSKLSAIEPNATADQTASEIRTLVESATDSNVFTDADHTKLNNISPGAEVNVAQVQTDWNATSGLGEILNKPSIPAAYTDSDVDSHLNKSSASSGEVLSWTGSDYDWVAQSSGGISEVKDDTTPQLGGDLDVNGKDIVSTSNGNIELGPNGTGAVIFKGGATATGAANGAGRFKLNCENNSHGITIQGPPHSANADYTLTLPNNDGDAGEYLKTNGSGGLSWDTPSGGSSFPASGGTFTGTVTYNTDSLHKDGKKAKFGDNADLEIFHDYNFGTNHVKNSCPTTFEGTAKYKFTPEVEFENNLRIKDKDLYFYEGTDTSPTADLFAHSGGLNVNQLKGDFKVAVTGGNSTGDCIFQLPTGGDFIVKNNNVEKLRVDGDGLTLSHPTDSTYDIQFENSGSSGTLLTTSYGYILKTSTAAGEFKVRNGNDDNMIIASGDQAVKLYYDGIQKFQTTSSGATVSGTLIAGGLTYPTSDGSSGHVLTTDGNGNLSFAAASGGGSSTGDISFSTNEISTTDDQMVFKIDSDNNETGYEGYYFYGGPTSNGYIQYWINSTSQTGIKMQAGSNKTAFIQKNDEFKFILNEHGGNHPVHLFNYGNGSSAHINLGVRHADARVRVTDQNNNLFYALPRATPSNGDVLTASDANGTLGWAAPSGGGLTYFTEGESNGTQQTSTLTAATDNANLADKNLALIPRGDGALTAQAPDGSATGGNARGTNAVDFGRGRSQATEVASGNYASISGGYRSKASGAYSTVGGGQEVHATGGNSVASGGQENSADGSHSTICGGSNNDADGNYSFVGGGSSNDAASYGSLVCGGVGNEAKDNSYTTIVGGLNNDATGEYSFVGGGESNTSSGQKSFVGGGKSNTATNTTAVVAGGEGNDATFPRATICGGLSNEASANVATIAGGYANTASGDYASIGGGGSNTASSNYSFVGGGNSNQAKTNSYATVVGGNGNIADGEKSFVGGGQGNEANGEKSVVSGGQNNEAGYRAAVVGGATNSATGNYGVIGGGLNNTASTYYAFVGNGYYNEAKTNSGATVVGGEYNIASGGNSFVGGGYSNDATGANSFVGGGNGNLASGVRSTVGGGESNTASYNGGGGHTTVSGGKSNTASAYLATIGGGRDNTASSNYALVCGGASNEAKTNNYATIVGGQNNEATGAYSFIGGGYDNLASAEYSTVSGGTDNEALTLRSFIGGGSGNATGGSWSTIAGGKNNTVSGTYGGVFTGSGNNVGSGDYAVILGGLSNKATGKYSTVLNGPYAEAATASEVAFGGGYVFASSDKQNQHSTYLFATQVASSVGNIDLSASPPSFGETLKSEGSTIGRVTVPNSRSGRVDVTWTCIQGSSKVRSGKLSFVFKKGSGTSAPTIVPSEPTSYDEIGDSISLGNTPITFLASGSTTTESDFQFYVGGDGSNTLHWQAKIDVTMLANN